MAKGIFWALAYIATILCVNIAFSYWPSYELLWSALIGTVFITRDLCQRHIGHWCLLAMVVAGLLSYVLADPFVALASVSAFAVSELADWAVYSIYKRPLADRILISSSISVPLDSAVFLLMLGIFTPTLFAVQIASKMASAIIIYGGMKAHARAT